LYECIMDPDVTV